MRAFAARASPRALVPPCAPLSKRHRGSLAICVVRRAPGRGVRVVIANASSNADTSRLDRAFAFAEEYTKHSSATFYFATRLMNLDTRRKVWAIYAWCRALDETVDGIEARNAGSAPAAVEKKTSCAPHHARLALAANLDDLPRRVRWARANPEAAATIARRAQEFATSLHVFEVACFWWQLLTAMAPLQNFEPRTQSALGFAPVQRS